MRDFLGFRFGNIHSDDLHLKVVSSGDRYDKNLLPEPTNYTQDIPGSNGQYYWGQTYSTREFTINVAFEDLDEQTWRRISQIFSTDKPQDLVFDENPYKTYKVKLKSAPDFKFVCFKDRNTGKRIYKGEGTFNFVCFHPLAFCYNKYVVRAADYYKCVTPEDIIENRNSVEFNPYRHAGAAQILTKTIKEHYNTLQNTNTPWKGGYPTIEQVQNGELYFCKDDEDKTEKKNGTLITDVRGYWDNIPKWEDTAKLLTTPTLDYDQELIYLPQYCRNHYYNMDIGLTNTNALIGSRLLVYNPGDVPVDFELRLGHLASTMIGNPKGIFRISRYNVQRLTIDQAVDWPGLKIKTLRRDSNLSEQQYNEQYKYGTKYFTILNNEIVEIDQENRGLPIEKELNYSHPNHCYYIEPIPQEHLAHFIKLFYWQTNLLLGEGTLDYEEAISFANRYEELRSGCITEDERNELYWITLKVAILDKYKEKFDFPSDYNFDQFVEDYLNIGPEYIRAAADQNYGEFIFNLSRMPQWYTYDYMDITTEDFDKLSTVVNNCPSDRIHMDRLETILPLFFNTETRMLYGMRDPEWENSVTFKKAYPEKEKNFFNYKPQKLILNKNIVRGHWFQLPPGWSLIDISPLSDEKDWGGKRWIDARQFDWGKVDESYREYYNKIYKYTAIEFLNKYYPEKLRDKEVDNLTICDIDEILQFRRWFEEEIYTDCAAPYNSRIFSQYNDVVPAQGEYSDNLKNSFKFELYKYRTEKAEYEFLKLLKEYWEADKGNSEFNTGSINDWWWYASNYTWGNFPPLYLGWVDLLNEAQIKYIPQFY